MHVYNRWVTIEQPWPFTSIHPQTAAGYTIPAGHQVCVSPTVNHRLQDTWTERMEFRPDRYLNDNPAAVEKFAYVPFGAGKNIFLLFPPF